MHKNFWLHFSIYFFVLVSAPVVAQKEITFINHLRTYELEQAKKQLDELPKSFLESAKWQLNFLIQFNTKDATFNAIVEIPKPNDSGFGDFLYHTNWGDYYFYNSLDNNTKAMEQYKIVLSIGKSMNESILISEALKRILTLHRIHYLYNNQTYIPFLEDLKEHANDDYDLAYFHYFNLILNFKNYKPEKWSNTSYNYLNHFFETNQHPYLNGISRLVFASYFEEINKPDSVWYSGKMAVQELKSIPYNYKGSRLNQAYSFLARISLQNNNYKQAKKYKDSAIANYYHSVDKNFISLGYYQQSVIDSANGDFLNAYDQSMKYRVSMAQIEGAAQVDKFNELEVKYETAEKEKELLLEQKENRKNRNIASGLGGGLLTVSIIGFLVYKNTKRKQRFAEQEKQLEIQEKEALLKDQEIQAINAMIEGQEKERQRVASDLHDSIGATLSAARLQFEHLNTHKNSGMNLDEIFYKTSKLLEDAYQEVRAMAHLKNSGVLAKNGLLPAIEKLAKNATTNTLQFEVQHFGLKERLDNEKEITLFRIVQELVTNIIKHSQATEASISLTERDDTLSIIVEDNGKGFDPRKKQHSDGMGLSSIEKRIEHWEGTIEVDSSPGNGTSILIELPV